MTRPNPPRPVTKLVKVQSQSEKVDTDIYIVFVLIQPLILVHRTWEHVTIMAVAAAAVPFPNLKVMMIAGVDK